ncbi:MAG: xanthine dehydrogenase family protein molybdopterin-binding subunit, partial [Alphaproteobacteria bacterium]|nr:xanthine dehydrogenase family protein molybdopterin-binding subunit [Alphaproteobacteria bacterium]
MSDPVTKSATQANLQYRQIGKPLTRTDARGKSTGELRYAGDHVMPGMLHAKVLRSPLASARLKRLDVTKARNLLGVAAVLTAAELPDRFAPTDLPGQTGRKRTDTDQQILVKEIARYHGEPMALVAAESVAIAEKAVALIEFELEELPVVSDPFEAMKPGAPLVQGSNNVVAEYKIRKGDVEKGFAEAETIVENTYQTQFIEHAFLEPEVGLAWVDEFEVINIRMSTQVIEHFRFVADALDLPHNKIRIQGSLVGGGFGGKEDVTVEIYLALLARHTMRPVRLAYTREDSFFGHGKRHPFYINHRTGFTKDGRITALEVSVTTDAGAYVFLSPYVLLYNAVAAPGPYRVDNLKIDAVAAATNNMYTSAFRGFGAAQACVAYEAQMDEAAKILGLDRLELRRRNFIATGDTMSTGFPIESATWTEDCMDQAWAALGEKAPDHGPIKVGRGVAAYQQSYGRMTWVHDTSEAWVGMEMDGTVVVRSGITDIGAGQTSALGQIAAELLGVGLDDVTIYNSDSAVTPLAGTTTATRGLLMSGNSVRLAAEAVRERFVERAAKEWNVPPETI